MFSVALRSGESIFSIAFVGVFVLVGLALVAYLLTHLYQRWRVGKTTLVLVPQHVIAGDVVTLTLRAARAFESTQRVTFALIIERYDGEDWIALQTASGSATLHASLLSTSVRIAVPSVAQAETQDAKLRCRAEAFVGTWTLVKAQRDLVLGTDERPWAPSEQAVQLSGAQPAASDVHSRAIAPTGSAGAVGVISASSAIASDSPALPPADAKEIAPGVWQWTLRSRLLQGVGVVLLVFSFFWWRNIGVDRLVIDVFFNPARSSPVGAAELGLMLFQLPFVVAGIFCTLLGIVFVFGHIVAVVRPGEMHYRVRALGRTAYEHSVAASAIVALHPHAFATSSNRSAAHASASSVALAARTADSLEWLPLTAPSVAEVAGRARWLALRLGTDPVVFDPQPVNAKARGERNANGEMVPTPASSIARVFKRAMGVSTVLALIGFAVMFASTFAQ